MKQMAEKKQSEYRKAAQRQEQEDKRKGGLLATFLADDGEDKPAGGIVVDRKQEEWYDFLSEERPATVTEPIDTVAADKKSPWFGWAKEKSDKVTTDESLAASEPLEPTPSALEEVKEEPDWFSWAVGKGPKDRKADKSDWFNSWARDNPKDAPTVVPSSADVQPAVGPETPSTEPKDEPEWFTWLKPKRDAGVNGGMDRGMGLDVVTKEPPPLGTEEVSETVKAKKPSAFEMFFASTPAVLAEKAAPTVTIEKPKPVVVQPEKEEKVVVVEAPAVVVPEMAAYVLPDPKKIFWGGEDATFVKGRSFGVFDGVSGAEKLDGVPLYSATLAREVKSKIGNEGLEIKDMIEVLNGVVEYANKRATGASTALVGSISEDGVLRILNVGDSTAIVIRDERVVARTREINHFYECPYQFSEISPDKPRDGTKLNLPLRKGDIIIAGSDGIFDNLEEDQIVKEVASSPKKASVIAKRVSDLSRRVSQNPKAVTPFSRQALKKRNPDYPDGVGGKVDDVCCVAIRYG